MKDLKGLWWLIPAGVVGWAWMRSQQPPGAVPYRPQQQISRPAPPSPPAPKPRRIDLNRPARPGRLGGAALMKLLNNVEWPHGITPLYLAVLARFESGWKPTAQTGKHRGLWQRAPSSVSDWNKRETRRGSSERQTVEDLFDPLKSLPVVYKHFSTIVRSYALAGLTPADPEWFGLLTAGHNGGFSLAKGSAHGQGGVAKVYKAAKDDGVTLTVENLPEMAKRYGGTRHLYNLKKWNYWKKVTAAHEKLLRDDRQA